HVHLLGFDARGGIDRLGHVQAVDVGGGVLRWRIGRIHAQLRGFGDLVLDPLLEGFDLFGAENALLEKLLLEPCEAVVQRELVDLLLASIAALVVLRRVSPETVDEALDQRRALPRASPRHRLAGDDIASDRVTPVDGYAGESVAGGALSDMLDRVLLVERRRDGEAV